MLTFLKTTTIHFWSVLGCVQEHRETTYREPKDGAKNFLPGWRIDIQRYPEKQITRVDYTLVLYAQENGLGAIRWSVPICS